jgi:hypothetical protein
MRISFAYLRALRSSKLSPPRSRLCHRAHGHWQWAFFLDQAVAVFAGRRGLGTAEGNYGEQQHYLLLHAHNPVNWYRWGREAFEKAHREQKPIFSRRR